MQLSVNGADVFVATGGRPFDPSLPAVVMLHGAGFDHSTWALHSRWFAHHGYSVLAPDLPAHGRSSGAPLPTIADMADWTAALLDAAGMPKAKLVGHSMGSLIALETSARHPDKVSSLSLIGTAATMTVGPDLLKAAEFNNPDAIDMVSIWGLGFKAELGGSLAPGLWMHQGAQRVLQQTRPGVLYNDLNACNAYQNALAAAAQVKVPATFILGERDMMTPAKAGKTLAAATPNARTVVAAGRRPHDDGRSTGRVAGGVAVVIRTPLSLLILRSREAASRRMRATGGASWFETALRASSPRGSATAVPQASSPPDGYRSRATFPSAIHPSPACGRCGRGRVCGSNRRRR